MGSFEFSLWSKLLWAINAICGHLMHFCGYGTISPSLFVLKLILLSAEVSPANFTRILRLFYDCLIVTNVAETELVY